MNSNASTMEMENKAILIFSVLMNIEKTYMIKKWRHCNCIDGALSHISLDKSQGSDIPKLQ